MNEAVPSRPTRLDRHGAVAVVWLDRPERANAIAPDLFASLGRDLYAATTDESVSVVVLTGAGLHFCAGADVARGLRADDDMEATEATGGESPNPFEVLSQAEIPVLAAVEGAAVGIGLGLALATDVIVAAGSARFEAPQAQFGLVPDGGLAFSLPRTVGRQLARAMCLCGHALDGHDAHRRGLAAILVDDGAALDTAVALAQSTARVPRDALRRAKAVLDAGDAGAAAAGEAERRMLREGFHDPFFSRAVQHARASVLKRPSGPD